jgi:hypothetical protein
MQAAATTLLSKTFDMNEKALDRESSKKSRALVQPHGRYTGIIRSPLCWLLSLISPVMMLDIIQASFLFLPVPAVDDHQPPW